MDQLEYLMLHYPIIKNIIMIMVICRIIFKPIFLIIGKYVELTIEEDDNKKFNSFMKSKKYKMIVFIVDMIASIKLPTTKKGK